MTPRFGVARYAALLALTVASCGQEPTGPKGGDRGLIDPRVAPSVVSTYPPDGGVGPFDLFAPGNESRAHFVLQLDKAVDSQAFRSDWIQAEGFDRPVRFALLEPAYGWNDTPVHILFVRVLDPRAARALLYAPGRTYAITVGTGLVDLTGRHPVFPYRFSFTPEPRFRVVSARPNHGTVVDSQSELLVTFNSPIDSVARDALMVTPAVRGAWQLSGDSVSVRFRHVEPFPFGAAGSVQLPETAADARGNRLAAPFLWSFQVEPFRVADHLPRDRSSDIETNRVLSVYTTGEVDTASVRAAFGIEPAETGRFHFHATGFTFEFLPEMRTSTTYRVTISAALRSTDGTALAAPYAFSFTTTAFRVLRTYPYDGSQAPRYSHIQVDCTAAVDSISLPAAFSIIPAVRGTFWVPAGSHSFQFTPDSLLAPSTRYTVTISTDLRTIRDAPLEGPYAFWFTTEPSSNSARPQGSMASRMRSRP